MFSFYTATFSLIGPSGLTWWLIKSPDQGWYVHMYMGRFLVEYVYSQSLYYFLLWNLHPVQIHNYDNYNAPEFPNWNLEGVRENFTAKA